MATHSSILARRIPWTEESGGLQSMGDQTWAFYLRSLSDLTAIRLMRKYFLSSNYVPDTLYGVGIQG